MPVNLQRSEVEETVETLNVAENMESDGLNELGSEVVESFDMDLDSRSDWEERNEQWMRLATQVYEEKSYPWPGASNVKYPLLTTAAIQFHARAQQALLKGNRPVLAKPIGKDPDGEKRSRSERVSKFMSYQILQEMKEWQDDMDQLLFVLPIVGLCFKKTFYSPSKKRLCSELVLPKDLVVHYHAQDFDRARKTHCIYKDKNEVEELMRTGIYRRVDLPDPSGMVDKGGVSDEVQGLDDNSPQEDIPYTILEVHGWWDLDDDGYKEPWIVTVEKDSKTILRVTARFNPDDIEYGVDGEVAKITPIEYFTRYPFLPDFESKVYGLGFGIILGPLNAAVNTVTNQLIDAGTISNMPGGFLGRGIRLSRGGPTRFRPGEWQAVHSTGDDLRKGIFPLPIKEPSTVLFQLLGSLIQSGEKVGSINEALLGENPGQNQPYSTTAAILEQGLKVFVGIYKRIYRALTKEYENLFRLNSIYLDEAMYNEILDEDVQVTREDFDRSRFDIVPSADPDIASETQALLKAESLLQKVMAGLPINPQIALKKVLEAEGHENIDELMQVPEPQPDPKVVLEMQKLEHQKQIEWAELQHEAQKAEFEAVKDKAQAVLNFAKAQDTQDSAALEKAKFEVDSILKAQDQQIEKQKAFSDFVTKTRDQQLKAKELEQKKNETATEQVSPKE